MDTIYTRHRFEVRRRTLTLVSRVALTPGMLRLVFESPDLADFQSPAPDDHIKLMFDTGGERPEMREYTPRAYDRAAGRLTLDFALHEAGPATAWARAARPGDSLVIGGPRGSTEVTAEFDWFLLIGDETALPAMGRWLEEMAPGQQVITLGLVTDGAEEQDFGGLAAQTRHWCHRGDPADPAPALAALRALPALPEGRGFVWIAAEAAVARALRDQVLNERGHPRHWLKAAGYWTRGLADTSDKSLE